MSFLTAIFALLIGGIIMGFSPVFVREAEVDAFASAFWRVLFALPVLYAWAFFEKPSRRPGLSTTYPIMLAGFFFAGDLVFWHLAILHTTMANATFMVCLSPVWVAAISPYMLGEKNNPTAILGLIICVAGLMLLMGSSFQIDPARLTGDIYGLITSFFLGSYFVAIRFARKETASGELFWKSTVITTAILFVVAIVAGGTLLPTSASGWFSLVSLGVVTHAGGQGLVTIAMGVLTAVFSSLVIFIEAIAAAFFGWLIFDETMSPLQWSGSILILFGVWLSRPRANGS
ncbi:MAG: DMT family transporter [Pseudomonadota bacterium]